MAWEATFRNSDGKTNIDKKVISGYKELTEKK